MEIYLPTLEQKIVELVTAFRFIVFAIMVVGLVVYASRPGGQGADLFRVLTRAIVLVAAIAYMNVWFPKVEQTFLHIAEFVDPGYNEHPAAAADAIRQSTADNPEGQTWSWRHLNESIYQAVSRALANVFIYIGTLVTVPMHILQYVLRWLIYLIMPFMLALVMVPGMSGIAVRFFQQMLAVLAWPIGFALTNLVALSVWNDFRSAVGPNPATVGDALYSPLLTMMGGILATVMILVGMLATPVVMQMLFAQGHAFSGASANVAHWVRSGSSMIYGVGDRVFPRGATTLAPQASVSVAPPRPPPPPLGIEARPGI
ncbi:hypothetical protein DB347_25070 [Opitutaceae bacterium EW11]|nr:hypothetical protein DB347_25070 [Opitutaceae bacterium EW11]